MDDNRRFGLSGKARGRIYQVASLVTFVGMVVGGAARPYWVAGILLLLGWCLVIDPVNLKGQRTFLGMSREAARKWGLGSVFGRKVDD